MPIELPFFKALPRMIRFLGLFLPGLVLAGEQVTNEHINAHWLDGDRLSYRLDGPDEVQQWVLDARTGVRTLHSFNEPLRLPPRRVPGSTNGGEEANLQFINRLKVPLQLAWITPEGTVRPYGTLAPGLIRDQHTYSGHAWRLIGPQGVAHAGFVAPPGKSVAVVDDSTLEQWNTLSLLSAKSESEPKLGDEHTNLTRVHKQKVSTADR